jgi:integrase
LTEGLEQLAELVRAKNEADLSIARLLGRPALSGNIGEFVDPPHPSGGLRAHRRKAGLPTEFIPHSLRHCYAPSLAHGIPINEASRWLGHKGIEVTHQIYGHLVPTSWDRARTVLDDARRAGRHQPPRPKPRT